MDSRDNSATTPEEYLGGTASWRTTLYEDSCPRVPTHNESIYAVRNEWSHGKFTPELKPVEIEMPYEGTYTLENYAQQLIDEYEAAGIPPEDVWQQSFRWEDTYYWVQNTDYYQAVALDGNYDAYHYNDTEMEMHLQRLIDNNVTIVAPPMWMLVTSEVSNKGAAKIVSSPYADKANEMELGIISWTIERSGSLTGGGGWYYQSTNGNMGTPDAIDNDGDVLLLLKALDQQVGIIAMFSDWPGTSTLYGNCMM